MRRGGGSPCLSMAIQGTRPLPPRSGSGPMRRSQPIWISDSIGSLPKPLWTPSSARGSWAGMTRPSQWTLGPPGGTCGSGKETFANPRLPVPGTSLSLCLQGLDAGAVISVSQEPTSPSEGSDTPLDPVFPRLRSRLPLSDRNYIRSSLSKGEKGQTCLPYGMTWPWSCLRRWGKYSRGSHSSGPGAGYA